MSANCVNAIASFGSLFGATSNWIRQYGVETQNEDSMRSERAFTDEFFCSSGGKGVHSLQIPGQTHQTPFAASAACSTQRELPEFHDSLDQPEHWLDGALAQGVQLATSSRLQAMPHRFQRRNFPPNGGGSLKRSRSDG